MHYIKRFSIKCYQMFSLYTIQILWTTIMMHFVIFLTWQFLTCFACSVWKRAVWISFCVLRKKVTVMNPVYELPFTHHQRSLTHSPHGLLHYTNCCTLPWTTVPITHCTDDTHTADCTDYIAYSHHTPYLSHGLPQSDRRVLLAHIATLADNYLTEPNVVVIVIV